jgi:hypothetical protein
MVQLKCSSQVETGVIANNIPEEASSRIMLYDHDTRMSGSLGRTIALFKSCATFVFGLETRIKCNRSRYHKIHILDASKVDLPKKERKK